MSVIETSEVAKAMFEALQVNGGWMTREALREAIGRKRFTTYDVNMLDVLISQGLVTGEFRIRGQFQRYWVYKARAVQHG